MECSKCYQSIISSKINDSALKQIISCKSVQICAERIFKLDNLTSKQRLNVLNNLNSVKYIQYNYLEHFLSNNPERKLAFTLLFFNNPDLIYKLAYRNKLLKSELQLVYSRYSNYFYKKTKKRFRSYYRYCMVFNDFLSDNEKKLLIKYLKKDRYWHYIKVSLKDFKFNKFQRDTLLKYNIMYKLIRCLMWITFIYYITMYKQYYDDLLNISFDYINLF